jgi:hypothetical protein
LFEIILKLLSKIVKYIIGSVKIRRL